MSGLLRDTLRFHSIFTLSFPKTVGDAKEDNISCFSIQQSIFGSSVYIEKISCLTTSPSVLCWSSCREVLIRCEVLLGDTELRRWHLLFRVGSVGRH